MKPLQRIVNALREKEGVDSEGDRTYRVHLTTAEDLVNEAYRVGRSEGNSEIAKLRALLAEEIKWGHRKCVDGDCLSSGTDCPAQNGVEL